MKKRELGKNEVRVIKINQNAICEILFDAIMKHTSNSFDLKKKSNPLRMMYFNPDSLEVTYAVCNFENRNNIDMEEVAARINVTTESLLTKLDDDPKYVVIHPDNYENTEK